MEINAWISGCKCRIFPWGDGKTYYVNVQYFPSGSSVYKPAWEKTVYVTKNDAGREVLMDYLDSFIEYICGLKINDDKKIVITF
jgi:hypothetical protein